MDSALLLIKIVLFTILVGMSFSMAFEIGKVIVQEVYNNIKIKRYKKAMNEHKDATIERRR